MLLHIVLRRSSQSHLRLEHTPKRVKTCEIFRRQSLGRPPEVSVRVGFFCKIFEVLVNSPADVFVESWWNLCRCSITSCRVAAS